MPYSYCIPARIVDYTHPLDNRVSGTVAIEGRLLTFGTRKHIVQATNKIYSAAPWKPKAGSAVLVDGDLTATHLMVDHIEPDLCTDMPCENPILDRLTPLLERMPTATAHLRHWKPADRTDGRWRLRWRNLAIKGPGLDVDRGAVLHAIRDSLFDEWRVWLTDADNGRVVHAGLPRTAERLVALTLGEGVASSEPKPVLARMPTPLPPSDDCPF